MKVLDSKIIEADSMENMAVKTRKLVLEGYTSVGGLRVFTQPAPSYKDVLIQEMVKFEKEVSDE